jgi:hypothetical protein
MYAFTGGVERFTAPGGHNECVAALNGGAHPLTYYCYTTALGVYSYNGSLQLQ